MRFIPAVAVLCFVFGACAPGHTYPIAPQRGPSCAFFANIPALAYASGVDIGPSRDFTRSIYALHRGDAEFGRAFSKEKFYALFAIPHGRHRLPHDDLPVAVLTENVENLILKNFDPGLAHGDVFSLRVKGVYSTAHNVLLMEKERNAYVVHDPYPGLLKRMTRRELAEWMLVPTSATAKLAEKRHLSEYLRISLPHRHEAPWKTLDDLPTALEVDWNKGGRDSLRKAFTPVAGGGAGLDGRIARFPGIDFAVLPPSHVGGAHRPAVDGKLDAASLRGVINLAKFTLGVWSIGNRDRLPVLFMRGRPHVLVAYRSGPGATLAFDDGKRILRLSPARAVAEFKRDGCHYGTIRMPAGHSEES